MSAYEIPASQLRQFIFCKRIPYIVLVLGAQPPAPPWAKLGEEWHNRRFKKEKRRQLQAYGMQKSKLLFEVPLFSDELSLTGRADIIIEGINHIAIVECKNGKAKINKGLLLQTYAYKLMAEKVFDKPCANCFLVSRNQKTMKKIIYPEKFHDTFIEVVNKIREMLEAETIPAQIPAVSKCLQCEFINWCGDRF